MKKAFTLMEVNLAIMIMATGILAVVSLYSFGYRENRQSRDDVASAVYADAVMSPLVMALSATNVKWSVFRELKNEPGDEGWGEYFNDDGTPDGNPDGTARKVFSDVIGKMSASGVSAAWPSSASGGLKAGLVVTHEEGSPVVGICFRASKHAGELLSMPAFYTTVRFQGRSDE